MGDAFSVPFILSCLAYHRLFYMAYKEALLSAFKNPKPVYHITNIILVKGDAISDQILAVPGVEHSFSGVVVYHGVVAVLIGELNVGVPLFPSLGVVRKVDGRGL